MPPKRRSKVQKPTWYSKATEMALAHPYAAGGVALGAAALPIGLFTFLPFLWRPEIKGKGGADVRLPAAAPPLLPKNATPKIVPIAEELPKGRAEPVEPTQDELVELREIARNVPLSDIDEEYQERKDEAKSIQEEEGITASLNIVNGDKFYQLVKKYFVLAPKDFLLYFITDNPEYFQYGTDGNLKVLSSYEDELVPHLQLFAKFKENLADFEKLPIVIIVDEGDEGQPVLEDPEKVKYLTTFNNVYDSLRPMRVGGVRPKLVQAAEKVLSDEDFEMDPEAEDPFAGYDPFATSPHPPEVVVGAANVVNAAAAVGDIPPDEPVVAVAGAVQKLLEDIAVPEAPPAPPMEAPEAPPVPKEKPKPKARSPKPAKADTQANLLAAIRGGTTLKKTRSKQEAASPAKVKKEFGKLDFQKGPTYIEDQLKQKEDQVTALVNELVKSGQQAIDEFEAKLSRLEVQKGQIKMNHPRVGGAVLPLQSYWINKPSEAKEIPDYQLEYLSLQGQTILYETILAKLKQAIAQKLGQPGATKEEGLGGLMRQAAQGLRAAIKEESPVSSEESSPWED